MYKCQCGKTYTREQVDKVRKRSISEIGCGRCKQVGLLSLDYDIFKLTVFRIIASTSLGYIIPRLEQLSEDFNISYDKVVDDFNEYTNDYWKENIQETKPRTLSHTEASAWFHSQK